MVLILSSPDKSLGKRASRKFDNLQISLLQEPILSKKGATRDSKLSKIFLDGMTIVFYLKFQ